MRGSEYIANTFGGKTVHDIPESEGFYDIMILNRTN